VLEILVNKFFANMAEKGSGDTPPAAEEEEKK
jgi:hypothetical protein